MLPTKGGVLIAVLLLTLASGSGCSDSSTARSPATNASLLSDEGPDSPGDDAAPETGPVDREALQQAGEEAQDRKFSCLEERGFRVDRAPDGSATIHQPEGDTDGEVTRQAMMECEELAAFPELVPLTDEELDGMYGLMVEAEACLRDNGFDPEPAVSREQYVQDYRSSNGGWNPYASLVEDLAAAEQVCPQPDLTDL